MESNSVNPYYVILRPCQKPS